VAEEITPEGVMEYEPIRDKSLIKYKCGRCGHEVSLEDLEYIGSIKCPNCGYRILYKVRPPGRKLVRAV